MTEMKAKLIVYGGAAFDPDRVQAAIGLAPDEIHHIGDPIGRSIRKHKENYWVVSTGYFKCIDLTLCIAPVLARMEPFWEKLRTAIPAGTEIELSVVASVDDIVPALHLEKDEIRKLAELGISLDIDLYKVPITTKGDGPSPWMLARETNRT